MKTINYFWLVLIIAIAIVSFMSGKDMQKRNNMQDFAEYEGRINELIKVNTTHIEGKKHLQNELDQKTYELELAKTEYSKLQVDLANSYQDPNIPDAPADELIIFTPDISEPEIVEIIKMVDREFEDECVYLYRDDTNNYRFDLNVKYVSKAGIFYFEPENLNLEPLRQKRDRNTTLSVQWFGNTEGLVQFQHEVVSWLPIGFSAGVIDGDFRAGVMIGFRF